MRCKWIMWIAFGALALAQDPLVAQQNKAAPPPDGKELVAVLEMDGVGATKGELAAATEELRAQLLHTGRFRVVDRQQIDSILKEQALQQTGCTSQECAVQVGRILGVRKIVTGRITKIDRALWQAAVQMVDVESGETLRAETVNQPGTFAALLGEGLSALTAKLTEGVARASLAASSAAPVVTTPAATAPPGQTWRDPVTGMDFVWVPGGSFEMGCGSWDRDCYDSEKPVHQATVGGFWLGRTEVTQGRWTRIMGSNPSSFTTGDSYPVEQVSWDDVQQFIGKLNGQSGGVRFRLPTEAEWEYACRAGGREQVYAWGNADPSGSSGKVANIADASAKQKYANFSWALTSYDDGNAETAPVASFPPNGLGLFDMSGNVDEWVQDAFQTYSTGPATDPVVESGAHRVFRGGGWPDDARYARCSGRYRSSPSFRSSLLGFRLARSN